MKINSSHFDASSNFTPLLWTSSNGALFTHTVRWRNNGQWQTFYFLGLQNHCGWWFSHEIKRCLLLGRKAMPNLDSLQKVCLVKAMVFPAVMYGCECWTIKKAKHWRIDAFELSISCSKLEKDKYRMISLIYGTYSMTQRNLSTKQIILWSTKQKQAQRHSYSPWGHKESDMTEWLNWIEGPYDYIELNQKIWNNLLF